MTIIIIWHVPLRRRRRSGNLAAINSCEILLPSLVLFPLPLRLSLISYGARSSPLSGLSPSWSSPLFPLSREVWQSIVSSSSSLLPQSQSQSKGATTCIPNGIRRTGAGAACGENFLPSFLSSRDPPLIRLLGRNLQNRGETWFSDGSLVRSFCGIYAE